MAVGAIVRFDPMDLSQFDYYLPDTLIAQQPVEERSQSRLLALNSANGEIRDLRFIDWLELLSPRDLLILNDTRVVPARLFGRKSTGGSMELMLERLLDNDSALVQTRASKTVRIGHRILIEDSGVELEVTESRGEFRVVRRLDGRSFLELLERYGHVPLPPYIARADEAHDRERYQSVFARKPGAVAAPTASLHLDNDYLSKIRRQKIRTEFITLHVGAGTFQPIRSDNITHHRLHPEWFRIPERTAKSIRQTLADRGKIVAVGTTVARALESWEMAGSPGEYEGETELFIRPGFEFKVVDALLTNFHLPKSSLLMLVCAFAGTEFTLKAYHHAVRQNYRFYSYGDAMFITGRF